MKILIVKSSSLGDIIHAFPVLDYLREKFPNGQIDWVVEEPCSELLKAHPAVNRLVIIQTKKWRKSLFQKKTFAEIKAFRKGLRKTTYDVVFDLQGNLKSSCVLLQTKAKKKVGFGWKSVPEWPNCFFTNVKFNRTQSGNIREDYLKIIQSFFSDPSTPNFKKSILSQSKEISLAPIPKNSILICPGAHWENKRLSEETMVDFLQRINQKFSVFFLFTWGNEEERLGAEKLSQYFPNSRLLERLTLSHLQRVMADCALVIGMDSLPLHLCGTTETSSIGFFGPSSSQKYAPIGKSHLSIQGECPYEVQFTGRCPKLRTCQTGSCMKQLKGEVLFEKTRSYLEKTLASFKKL